MNLEPIGPRRRASTRHDVTVEAVLAFDARVILCVITNLSFGGAFASTPRFPIGSRGVVMFPVPGLELAIEVGAVVRWATDDGVGLQFEGLRAREVWALGRYFASLG